MNSAKYTTTNHRKSATIKNTDGYMRMDSKAGEEETLVINFDEVENQKAEMKLADNNEKQEIIKVLRPLHDEDLDFMDYIDLYERNDDEVEAAEEAMQPEFDFPYEPITVDPNNFYNNALVYNSRNNGVEGWWTGDKDLSFITMSEVAVERFLTGRNQEPKMKPFMKNYEKSSTGVTQGNYTAVWYQDLEHIELETLPGKKGDYVLPNNENFTWITKKYKYQEHLTLTDEEKRYIKIIQELKQSPILLDPKIHKVMQMLSDQLQRLKTQGLSKNDFLQGLTSMHVGILITRESLSGELQQDTEFKL